MPPGFALPRGTAWNPPAPVPIGWDTCKHAVAVVLEYLECLKADSGVGEIDEDDPRLLKLEALEDEDYEEENVKARSGRSKSKKSKAASLHKQLQTINRRSGNPLAGLALQAEEFFAAPGLFGFQELCKAAHKARVGEGVEAWGAALSGNRPATRCRSETQE